MGAIAPAQAAAPSLPGMMHQDGPTSGSAMVGRSSPWTMYLLGLLRRRRTMSFQGVSPGPRACLRRPRQPLWNTPEAGGKVDKDTTQVGRALAHRHRVDPGLLARGKGALGAHVRHLAEAPAPGTQVAGITDMVEANRFLKEVFLPQHNARFATPAEDRGTAFVPFTGALECIHEERSYKWQDPRRPPPSRPAASTNTPTAQWPSSMDRDVWRDTTPMANRSTAKPARPRDPLRRDRPAPCGQVDSRSATDHFPTGPETATEAVNSYGT